MAGYTKHKFNNDMQKVHDDIKKYITSIIPLLPRKYDFNNIKQLLEKYYPHELFIIKEQYKYYKTKEEYLIRIGKKSRYKPNELSAIIRNSNIYKEITSNEYLLKHEKIFNEIEREKYALNFSAFRTPKIMKIYKKIEIAKSKTQQVEPAFLDKLMGLYDKKTTTQKDKVYILVELQKYYCSKIIAFFYKKNDTEYNFQLRELIFQHLQSLGFSPVLRKQKYMIISSKNKKRRDFLKNIYSKERFNIEAIPEELEYRIQNSKDQKLKSYDYFISHSSKDHIEVQKLIKHLNANKKHVYCDWISDIDYLKRNLLGNETLSVIKTRIQQSKEVIFVISDKSRNSNWCQYELKYSHDLNKTLYQIDIRDIKKNIFTIKEMTDFKFTDDSYEKIKLW